MLFVNVLFSSITLHDNTPYMDNFKLTYFHDKNASQTIDSVVNQKFINHSNAYTFGYHRGVDWFRFDITNNSKELYYVLTAVEPYLEEVTLYYQKNGQYIEQKNGLQVLLKDKVNYYHKPAFILDFTQNKKMTFYIKTRGKITSANAFHLMTQSYFNRVYDHKDDFFYMMFFGVLLIISLLNFFIYYRLKEKMYLYYALYTFFYSIWLGIYSGLLLYTNVDGYFYEFLTVIPMFIMFLILFSIEFLNIKKHLKILYKPLRYMSYLFLFLAVMIWYQVNPWYQIMVYSGILSLLIIFMVALYLWRLVDDINIKIYLIIMLVYFFTLLLLAFMLSGILEYNDFTRYSFLYATVFEIVLFNMILINRFYIFYQEKVDAQNELIQTKIEIEKVLEDGIESRTQEIHKLVDEKELLLKELYHRVKNNFHNITSLLWLESVKIDDEQSKELILKTIARIKSMSMVNQYLYKVDNLTDISTKEYFSKLLKEIELAYKDKSLNIKLNIQEIYLDLDAVMNVSIIMNEVVTNAIKYCDKTPCKIEIELQQTKNHIMLIVQDNGKGFELPIKSTGMGMNLIEQFSQKLKGSHYQFSNEHGCKFVLTFDSITT